MKTSCLRPTAALLCTLSLAACGGGGDDTAPAGPAAGTGADGMRIALAAPPQLPAAAPAADGTAQRCGNVAFGTARTGEIQVPAGAVCVLQGTQVQGNLQLGAGSVLDARDVVVQGNVQAQAAASVLLAGGRVGGSVQLERGGQASVLGVAIDGNLQLQSNTGALTVRDNRIGGNLQCQGNQPPPAGGGNTAASLEDQCAGLAAAPDPEPPVHPPVAPQPPGATLPPATPAAGANVECRDQSLGALTVANVSVPAGARCELIGTVLTGSLQAQAAAGLRLEGARLLGSLQWERGGALTASASQVGGSVRIDGATGLVWLQGLQVTGDIQLFDNLGGATLVDNRTGGNLQCKGNQPPPGGSGNLAAARQDQCAGL